MNNELLPHLFRSEFGKITSVLSRHFRLDRIEIAEDIASETFLLAMETWPYKGVPENPTAWLYAVAKNKTKNFVARARTFDEKIHPEILNENHNISSVDIDLSGENIRDSQLRMLFALCHPAIPPDAQVGLCLRILCGLGIDEIATAFLSNKETIAKRLQRAKEKLRSERVEMELPTDEHLISRMSNVLTTLYLLFNEGYYSETNEKVIREDLCEDAIRLTRMLVENNSTNLPEANALLSLMYFHSSRMKSRIDSRGELVLYEDQDAAVWNQHYITLGAFHLNKASTGNRISKYHLEAGIAYWHTIKDESIEKWDTILQLYNKLLQFEYSPIAALNRTYALSKVKGPDVAITEAEKLKLETNPYYFSLLAELYKKINPTLSQQHLRKALTLSKSPAEQKTIRKKLNQME
jgi:RNA polymerase sigma factor (sigma-70 family)